MAGRNIKSFDLFPVYAWYVPGAGGTLALLAMFLLGAAAGNLILIAGTLISPEVTETYGFLISYPVMFLPAMMYASFKSRRNALFDKGYSLDSSNFGEFSGTSIAIAVSIATIACAFLVDPVTGLLPEMPDSLKEVLKKMTDGPLWASLLAVSVFAPFFEEWLCRGMILRGLLQKTNPAAAVVISALVFAIIHMNPWQAIPAFILGLLFGYVYYRTGSLKLTMLMHCVNNTFSVLMGRLPGMEEAESFRDILSPSVYAATLVMCAAMTAFFIYRMHTFVRIPDGQSNGCDPAEPAETF